MSLGITGYSHLSPLPPSMPTIRLNIIYLELLINHYSSFFREGSVASSASDHLISPFYPCARSRISNTWFTVSTTELVSLIFSLTGSFAFVILSFSAFYAHTPLCRFLSTSPPIIYPILGSNTSIVFSVSALK